MVKKWGRERFYISCNYSCTISFLMKILLAKLKNLYIQYISIIKKQNSNHGYLQNVVWNTSNITLNNPIDDAPFFQSCSRIWGTKKVPLPKICLTYPTMMTLDTVIPYPKKIQKIYKSRDAPLEFCWHLLAFFHWKSASFATPRNTDKDCIWIHNF